MLKNFNIKLTFRNFLQNNFFFDFLLKSLCIKIVQNLLKITVFFLEKYIIEYFPKNLNYFLKTTFYFNFYFILIASLNIFLIINLI